MNQSLEQNHNKLQFISYTLPKPMYRNVANSTLGPHSRSADDPHGLNLDGALFELYFHCLRQLERLLIPGELLEMGACLRQGVKCARHYIVRVMTCRSYDMSEI